MDERIDETLRVKKRAAVATQHAQQARRQAAFLRAYATTGNITHAAQAAKVSRMAHYDWLADPDYVTAFAHAQEAAGDYLEREGWRRATEGQLRKKFTRGGRPIIDPETGEQYCEHEYSDTLLIFLLKGMRPEKYRERHEHSGPRGGPIELAAKRDWDSLSTEDLRELARLAEKLALPAGDSGATGETEPR